MTEKEYEKLDMQVKLLKICRVYGMIKYQDLVDFMLNYTPKDPDDIVGTEEYTELWIFKREFCKYMQYVLDEPQLFINYFSYSKSK